MIYALAAIFLSLLSYSMWMFYQGRKATKSDVTLEQVQEIGKELEEASDEVDDAVDDALKRLDDRLSGD